MTNMRYDFVTDYVMFHSENARVQTEEENGKLKSDRLCGIWVCLSTDTDCEREPIAGKRVQTPFQEIEEGRQIAHITQCNIKYGHSFALFIYGSPLNEPVQFQLLQINQKLSPLTVTLED